MSVLRKDMSGRMVSPVTPEEPADAGYPGSPGHWETYKVPMVVNFPGNGTPAAFFGGLGDEDESVVGLGSEFGALLPPVFPLPMVTVIWVTKRTWIPPFPARPAKPYQPAKPAVVQWLYNEGWDNAYAISIGGVDDGNAVEFKIPVDDTGIFVGLGTAHSYGATITSFAHGVLAQVDGIYIYERGKKDERLTTDINTVYTVRIERHSREIVYRVLNGNSLVACAVRDCDLDGDIHAFGYLYRGGDKISDARIFTHGVRAVGETEPLTLGVGARMIVFPLPNGAESACLLEMGIAMSARQSAVTLDVGARMSVMVDGRSGRGHFRLSAPQAKLSDHKSFGDIAATFPSLTASLTVGEIPPRRTSIDLTLTLPSFMGLLLKSAPGRIEATLPVIRGKLADHPFGELIVTLPRLDALLYQDPIPDMGMLFEVLMMHPNISSTAEHVVVFDSKGLLVDSFDVRREQVGELLARLRATDSVQATGSFLAEFAGCLRGNLHLSAIHTGKGPDGQPLERPDIAQGDRVWVVNVESGASWQYDGYGFNSFFERDGRHFGVAGDGIYQLEGKDDAGWPINASIDFGVSMLGSPYRKRVLAVYAGMTSTGRLLLKVETDSMTQIYAARSYAGDTRRLHRFDLGRTPVGTHWRFELLNEEGCDFDLDEVFFEPVTMAMRYR